MKRTTDGCRAHELEHVRATESGEFINKKLYVIDGEPGLWRRLPIRR